ncbi:hypothetical protein Tco_0400199, partial [Tanacetum coccineum]
MVMFSHFHNEITDLLFHNSPYFSPQPELLRSAQGDLRIGDGVRDPIEDGMGMRVEVASYVKEDEEEIEAEASVADTREIVVDPLAIGDSSESSRGGIPDLEDTVYDILEASQLMASGERASLADRTKSLERENLKEEFRHVRRDHDDTRRKLR